MSRYPRIVITGLGIVSPLGTGTQHVWKELLAGKSGIKKFDRFDVPCKIAGVVPRGSNVGQIDVDKILSKADMMTMAPFTQYAMCAAKEALEDANWNVNGGLLAERTGVSIGTGIGAIEDICNGASTFEKSGYHKLTPYFIPRILFNMPSSNIAKLYKFYGPLLSSSVACATGAQSIGDAYRVIQHHQADTMISGGTESCLNHVSMAAFCRLRSLTTSMNESPESASRPFDTKRDGFVMSEGSAVLILENLENVVSTSREKQIYAEVVGFGQSSDAYSLSSPEPDGKGAERAMSLAVKDANLSLGDIDMISAHATSTKLGDNAEANAIYRLFGSKPFVTAYKGNIGHMLGAAGAIETAFSSLAIKNQCIPAIKNFVSSEVKLNFVTKEIKHPVKYALCNSFGMGGVNVSLVLAKYS